MINKNDRNHGLSHLIRSVILHQSSIDQVAGEVSLSRRQFERRFKILTGFSPRMYERIIRFQRAADEYNGQHKSITQVALENGYYDHAHFSNEFKKFSGYRPKDYFSGAEEGYRWRDTDGYMSQISKL